MQNGGLMTYIRDDLPQRRGDDLEGYVCGSGRIEYIVMEIMIQGQKWLIWSVYKHPTVTNGPFCVVMEHILTDCNKDDSKYITV